MVSSAPRPGGGRRLSVLVRFVGGEAQPDLSPGESDIVTRATEGIGPALSLSVKAF